MLDAEVVPQKSIFALCPVMGQRAFQWKGRKDEDL